jgi:hypothetical protein
MQVPPASKLCMGLERERSTLAIIIRIQVPEAASPPLWNLS